MTEMTDPIDTSHLDHYFGVPVVVQLKFPLAAVKVSAKGRLPYADDPTASHWIPEPIMENGSPSGTQLLVYAVLHPIEGTTLLEVVWASVPDMPPEGSGALIGPIGTLATVIESKDIVAVTRVVSMPEASSLILPGR